MEKICRYATFPDSPMDWTGGRPVTFREHRFHLIIGSINQRRGRVENMEERTVQQSVIRATVPMERMFGYATELRSLTQGRASFTMTFSHYDI